MSFVIVIKTAEKSSFAEDFFRYCPFQHGLLCYELVMISPLAVLVCQPFRYVEFEKSPSAFLRCFPLFPYHDPYHGPKMGIYLPHCGFHTAYGEVIDPSPDDLIDFGDSVIK